VAVLWFSHPLGATSQVCRAQARRAGGTAAQLDDHLTEAATAVAINDARSPQKQRHFDLPH
jgi:hypothetical protein